MPSGKDLRAMHLRRFFEENGHLFGAHRGRKMKPDEYIGAWEQMIEQAEAPSSALLNQGGITFSTSLGSYIVYEVPASPPPPHCFDARDSIRTKCKNIVPLTDEEIILIYLQYSQHCAQWGRDTVFVRKIDDDKEIVWYTINKSDSGGTVFLARKSHPFVRQIGGNLSAFSRVIMKESDQ